LPLVSIVVMLGRIGGKGAVSVIVPAVVKVIVLPEVKFP
jgi:hypothetical protein